MINCKNENNECNCGSGNMYDNCCRKYIDGLELAPNPETLMRSRYTAYSLRDIDYIEKTLSGKALESFNGNEAKKWVMQSKWQGLDIIKAPMILDTNTLGYIEFIAMYEINNEEYKLHEISEFHKIDGIWYYVDGILNPKIGRNEICFCGAGKKYKKCCG